MSATFDTLRALDARWQAAGHHPLSPFWAGATAKLLKHPTARAFVARVGRGGAKIHQRQARRERGTGG